MGTRKKRPTSRVFFFLPAFGRYCAFGAPPSQLDRPCAPADVPLTTGSTLRLSTYSLLLRRHKKVARQWYTLPVGERWVNPLPDEASSTKWEPEKKDPFRGSFFSYRPLAGAAPRSVPTQQNFKVHAPKDFNSASSMRSNC